MDTNTGIAIGGGALSLLSAAAGTAVSAIQNKKARDLIKQQRADNKAWYESEMAKDPLMRVDAQAVINKQQQLLDEQRKRAQGAGVVGGASDESVAMQKAAGTSAMAQTMSNVASELDEYKRGVQQSYRQQDAALRQQEVGIRQNAANQVAQAAGQAVNAGVNLVGVGIKDKV